MNSINTISDKEWLDLAWKYFQQHAQQRILHFNYFITFSTILTTALATSFQINYKIHYLGIGIGAILSFLSFVFWKIDDRNRFLTKHSEDIIKEIEKHCCNTTYKLFTGEESKTVQQRNVSRSTIGFSRQFSHTKSYRIMYVGFFFIGLIGTICSTIIALS